MGLCGQKYYKLVIGYLHYLIMMIIIIIMLSPITYFCFHTHSSSFAVSLHTLLRTNIHYFLSLSYYFLLVAGWWLSYCCRYFYHCGKIKIFTHPQIFNSFIRLQKAWDIWHPKLNSVGQQVRDLKTHETGTKRSLPIRPTYFMFCPMQLSQLYILRNSRRWSCGINWYKK